MSDFNTGKPDMSDAIKKAIDEQLKAEKDAIIACHNMVEKTHALIMNIITNPARDPLFNGYSSELYNAGFRAQMDAQAKAFAKFLAEKPAED